jgi:hypothetical protein
LLEKISKKAPRFGTVQYYLDPRLNVGNLFDIFMIGCSICLAYISFSEPGCNESSERLNGSLDCSIGESTYHVLKMIVVTEQWVSLLGVFAWCESIAIQVLPIIYSFSSIRMLLLFTIGLVFIFAELLYVLQGPVAEAPVKTISSTFYYLFIGESDEITPDTSKGSFAYPEHMQDGVGYYGFSWTLLFILVILLFFTVWILNIFIAVIGTAFQEEKDNVQATFRQDRCKGVLRYLLRASVIKSQNCWLPTYETRRGDIFMGFIVLVMFSSYSTIFWPNDIASIAPEFLRTHSTLIRVLLHLVCLFLLQLMPFQRQNVPWATRDVPSGLNYLWIVRKQEDKLNSILTLETSSEPSRRHFREVEIAR